MIWQMNPSISPRILSWVRVLLTCAFLESLQRLRDSSRAKVVVTVLRFPKTCLTFLKLIRWDLRLSRTLISTSNFWRSRILIAQSEPYQIKTYQWKQTLWKILSRNRMLRKITHHLLRKERFGVTYHKLSVKICALPLTYCSAERWCISFRNCFGLASHLHTGQASWRQSWHLNSWKRQNTQEKFKCSSHRVSLLLFCWEWLNQLRAYSWGTSSTSSALRTRSYWIS